MLKTLPVAKASGPDDLSNRVLRELSKELSVPYCSLFNQSLRMGIVPSSYKEANVCPVPKTGDLSLWFPIIDPFHYLTRRIKF